MTPYVQTLLIDLQKIVESLHHRFHDKKVGTDHRPTCVSILDRLDHTLGNTVDRTKKPATPMSFDEVRTEVELAGQDMQTPNQQFANARNRIIAIMNADIVAKKRNGPDKPDAVKKGKGAKTPAAGESATVDMNEAGEVTDDDLDGDDDEDDADKSGTANEWANLDPANFSRVAGVDGEPAYEGAELRYIAANHPDDAIKAAAQSELDRRASLETEGGGEDDEPYTAGELHGMNREQIADIAAKEFEVKTTNDKGKDLSKSALIDAILEAQSDD